MWREFWRRQCRWLVISLSGEILRQKKGGLFILVSLFLRSPGSQLQLLIAVHGEAATAAAATTAATSFCNSGGE